MTAWAYLKWTNKETALGSLVFIFFLSDLPPLRASNGMAICMDGYDSDSA